MDIESQLEGTLSLVGTVVVQRGRELKGEGQKVGYLDNSCCINSEPPVPEDLFFSVSTTNFRQLKSFC